MSIKLPTPKSTITFDQIPHIVLNHPETNSDHWAIMIRLYKLLKDKPQCIYSNEQLAKDCRTSISNLQRRLKELQNFGFIIIAGKSYNRRFMLGQLFNACVNLTGSKLNTQVRLTKTSVRLTTNIGQPDLYTNNSTNNSFKRGFSVDKLSEEKQREVKHYLTYSKLIRPNDVQEIINKIEEKKNEKKISSV